MHSKRLHAASQHHSGFTLIELLVIVLALVFLMAMALPLYLSAVNDSQKNSCRTNMQTIANGVQAAHLKSGTSDYSSVIAAGVTHAALPELMAIPVCPSGGNYVLSFGSSGDAATFQVRCTYRNGAHGKYEPGVDTN